MEKERYEEVVYQYSDMVTRIAVMNVKNYDDAKDCYQNVFMKLYCYNKKFESEEHLKAWLIRVTINECKGYQKQFWKREIDIDKLILGQEDQRLIILRICQVNIVMFYTCIIMKDIQLMKLHLF